MGQFFLEPPQVSMENLHGDSDVTTPIIFVLSQGADPTS
jgi:dynein heavy chain